MSRIFKILPIVSLALLLGLWAITGIRPYDWFIAIMLTMTLIQWIIDYLADLKEGGQK